MADYLLRFRGRTDGPLPAGEVISRWRSGRISGLHECSTDGATWTPLSRLQVVTNDDGVEVIVERTEAIRHRAAAELSVQPPPLPPRSEEPPVPPRPRPRDRRIIDRTEPSTDNGMAVAGFVCSLVGLLLGPVAVLGLILSAIALGRPGLRGLAVSGLVIGIIGSLAWIVLLLLISAGR